MKQVTMRFLAVLALIPVTIAAGPDKTSPAYQKGTITGYETRLHNKNRRAKVYELKGADRIYDVDICGAFQAGKFQPGQAVDYRVMGERLYILRDDGKEYNCKIEGSRTLDREKTDDSTTH
jgi:hypothetical protein